MPHDPIPDKREVVEGLARSARVGYSVEELIQTTRVYFESLPTAEQVAGGLLAFSRRHHHSQRS